MFSDEEDLECTPPEIRNTANVAVNNLLPIKSRHRYENTYNSFVKWCEVKKIKNHTENVLLAYFQEISEHKKSLWSIYSMLRSCLNIKNNVDISKYPKLIKVLDDEHITKFLINAPNKEYLLMKTVLVIGISGACRRGELSKMLIKDIVFKDDIILVSVPETKTYVKREFAITKNEWVEIITQFLKIRLLVKNNDRFFLTYRSGKCVNLPVCINTIGKVPSSIATYLKLQNPQEYTGHCFRRSSATLLANKGSDFLSIKRHGGWKSSAVAEGYIQESLINKIQVAETLSESGPSGSNTSHVANAYISNALTNENTIRCPGISISTCENCTLNINIYNHDKENNN